MMLSRKMRVQRRIADLRENFEHYLSIFTKANPFRRAGQLEHHRETIRLVRELGEASQALDDDRFVDSLYHTLRAWGIGARGSKLVAMQHFGPTLRIHRPDILSLQGLAITEHVYEEDIEQIWEVIDSLTIVDNHAKMVPGTKALHHILPDLVVPVDRMYTQTFFGLHNPEFQYQQGSVFKSIFSTFNQIALAVRPQQWVESGWHTSPSKVIDNAVVGYCIAHALS